MDYASAAVAPESRLVRDSPPFPLPFPAPMTL